MHQESASYLPVLRQQINFWGDDRAFDTFLTKAIAQRSVTEMVGLAENPLQSLRAQIGELQPRLTHFDLENSSSTFSRFLLINIFWLINHSLANGLSKAEINAALGRPSRVAR